jgi:Trypsin-co-occurring domain 1
LAVAKYVNFPLDGGGQVCVEVSTSEGPVMRGDSGAVVENSALAFDAVLGKLKPICSAIAKQARGLIDQPEEFAVEFGVKLTAEAGVIVASTAAEANLKVSVKWKKSEQTKGT